MNNGFVGTGISIIFYLFLALVMPMVHMLQAARRRNIFRTRFVVRHFLFGLTIILCVVVVIAFIAARLGIKDRGTWRTAMTITAWSASSLLILWVATPYFVRLRRRLFGRRQTIYRETTIGPLSAPSRLPEYRMIDGVMSRRRWNIFRRQHYGS